MAYSAFRAFATRFVACSAQVRLSEVSTPRSFKEFDVSKPYSSRQGSPLKATALGFLEISSHEIILTVRVRTDQFEIISVSKISRHYTIRQIVVENLKIRGPRVVPCGTALLTGNSCETESATPTVCFRFSR